MADLLQSISDHSGTSDEDLKKAGKPAGNDMDDAHKKFLAGLIAKIDAKQINPLSPSSLIDQTKYAALNEMDQGKVDLNAVNMASQIQRIERFFRDKSIPDAAPELQTMINHLWDIKARVEKDHGSIFLF